MQRTERMPSYGPVRDPKPSTYGRRCLKCKRSRPLVGGKTLDRYARKWVCAECK